MCEATSRPSTAKLTIDHEGAIQKKALDRFSNVM
jgi:hypothetical protein